MKKLFSVLLIMSLMLAMAACGGGAEEPAAEGDAAASGADFEGKVAIVTNTVSQNEEEYRSAEIMVAKYGEDNITHVTWPDNFMAEQEQMVSTLARLAADPEVKAVILNQAVPGSNAAVDKMLETRDDIFIVYCTPQENPPDVAARADLVVQPDELQMGITIPEKSKEMGAETLVHYSFPRHMSVVLLAQRRDIMQETCAEIGVEFVDATAPDPTGDAGVPGAQQFILEDVPKMVAEYGTETAFFSTNCSLQIPLITAVLDEGAIYPQPCCPSPYHGFPSALGITSTGYSSEEMAQVVSDTAIALQEAGGLGRFATWPVPVSMMNTIASAEYAIKVINGEAPAEGIDMEILEQCMADYANLPVSTTPLVEGETTYDNFRMIMMDFLVYGEEHII